MSIAIPRNSFGTGSRVASRRASMCTVVSSEEKAEDMTNEEIVKAVEKLMATNHQLDLENKIFESFLARKEPTLLNDLQQCVDQAAHVAAARSRSLAVAALMLQPLTPSASMTNLSVRRDSLTSIHRERSPSIMRLGGAATPCEPRLTTSHKMDMARRESEELRISLEARRASAKHSREDLRARTESLSTALNEVKDWKEEFLRMAQMAKVANRGQKIPTEAFTKYMEEWLHKSGVTVKKLSIKTSLLRSLYARANRHLAQKLEIGDNVKQIDFQQIAIENKELAKQLAKSDREVIELKDISGKCGLKSSNISSNIAKLQSQLNCVHLKCVKTEYGIQRAREREAALKVEVNGLACQLNNTRELKKEYTAPDVMHYLKKKSEVENLKKEIKIWARRKSVQRSSLVPKTHVIRQVDVDVRGVQS